MKSSTDTLIAALRILSRDIYCEDGVATAAIAEAADRLEELRLTDAERTAVEAAIKCADLYDEEMDGFSSGVSKTLRGLLERIA